MFEQARVILYIVIFTTPLLIRVSLPHCNAGFFYFLHNLSIKPSPTSPEAINARHLARETRSDVRLSRLQRFRLSIMHGLCHPSAPAAMMTTTTTSGRLRLERQSSVARQIKAREGRETIRQASSVGRACVRMTRRK